MDRRKVRFRPSSPEAMEPLAPPSGALGALHAAAEGLTHPRRIELSASFQATYKTSSIPDVGTTYAVSGSGRGRNLGPSRIAGDLHTTGFIPSGHAQGTLKLSDARGTITLKLTGPTQSGFATLPDRFSFVIASGTGQFAHAKGSGTASVSLFPSPSQGSATETGAMTIALGT